MKPQNTTLSSSLLLSARVRELDGPTISPESFDLTRPVRVRPNDLKCKSEQQRFQGSTSAWRIRSDGELDAFAKGQTCLHAMRTDAVASKLIMFDCFLSITVFFVSVVVNSPRRSSSRSSFAVALCSQSRHHDIT